MMSRPTHPENGDLDWPLLIRRLRVCLSGFAATIAWRVPDVRAEVFAYGSSAFPLTASASFNADGEEVAVVETSVQRRPSGPDSTVATGLSGEFVMRADISDGGSGRVLFDVPTRSVQATGMDASEVVEDFIWAALRSFYEHSEVVIERLAATGLAIRDLPLDEPDHYQGYIQRWGPNPLHSREWLREITRSFATAFQGSVQSPPEVPHVTAYLSGAETSRWVLEVTEHLLASHTALTRQLLASYQALSEALSVLASTTRSPEEGERTT